MKDVEDADARHESRCDSKGNTQKKKIGIELSILEAA